jgi:hypothetical protein
MVESHMLQSQLGGAGPLKNSDKIMVMGVISQLLVVKFHRHYLEDHPT